MSEHIEDKIARLNMNAERMLADWGITSARKWSKVCWVLMLAIAAAGVIGLIAYFLFADGNLVQKQPIGLVLIVLLAVISVVARFPQLKAQRSDLHAFIDVLTPQLTGHPENDAEVQGNAESSFEWKSRFWMHVTRMILVAMVVLVVINTYQIQTLDLARQVVYDLAIACALAGFAWNQFTFRSELLEAELSVRLDATERFQRDPAWQEKLREEGYNVHAESDAPVIEGEAVEEDED